MKSFEQLYTRAPIWLILVGLCLILIFLSGMWLFNIEDPRMVGVVSGIFTGLILYVFGLIGQITTFWTLEKYRNIGVKALLNNRHEFTYYEPLMAEAKTYIKVMGASATRFLEDFMDVEADRHVLIDRLHTNPKLQVRILVPDAAHMSPDAGTRLLARLAKIEQLETDFKGRFQLRRFPHEARHSFVVVDGDFIGGPVFEGDKSKHAPAVHVEAGKPFAEKYNEYFDSVWSQCGQA